ncbi:helicase HerA-like domain-containing protein [uncultured Methanobrevibacter sp.]|uniref:helicase HerA-like domain-containing protein n=1 Tax=uncultured Methanobrevibacter sp. TaxID=253161 RepID=UPI002609C012|nr:helicase HerA-like domain-containing protein [uncultured Methanobrevibacter sp.]
MYAEDKILIGCNENVNVSLSPKLANRHGLIAGATGTGKTITLKTLAESFSDLGVPVFLADMKGDISGLAKLGSETEKIKTNVEKYHLAEMGFKYQAYPVEFWDLFGAKGLPIRVTLSEMGPVLLSKILNLSEAQQGVLNIIFRVADEESLLIIDLKDLKAMINHVVENKDKYESQYGAIAEKSANTILRSLLTLEDQGGNDFFGEPALDLNDFMKVDDNGKGIINILDAQKLSLSPEIYSTFLLWMLSELFENLPEVGDMDKPKFVFFFDEAHLLFDDMPEEFAKKVEQIVRLIRSKGVGLYFISQSPADIPDDILAQLGNRVQHALHAYTPKDQKAVKVAAETFRPNPEFSTADVISELGIGQALVSVLDEKGVPGIVEKVDIVPPQSYIGAIDDTMRSELINLSELKPKYGEAVDGLSAYEMLLEKIDSNPNIESEVAAVDKEIIEEVKAQEPAPEVVPEAPQQEAPAQGAESVLGDLLGTVLGGGQPAGGKKTKKSAQQKMVEKAATQAMNTAAREVTKGIMRGIFGQMK